MRVFTVLPLVTSLIVCACSGPPASTPTPPTAYSVTLTTLAAPGATPSPATSIVLYDQQFLDPQHSFALVGASIQPQPASTPALTWTSSSNAVQVSQSPPPGASATAAPGTTYVSVGAAYGVANLQVQVGSPVDRSAQIPVYHFPSLSLGCHFRYVPAMSFDPGASANGTSSDLYDTIGSDQLAPIDPCAGTAFATAAGTAEAWHTPHGGTFIANVTLSAFASIQASQWQNSGTQFAARSGVLIFKTQGGRIVKALLPIGPYEVSDTTGVFPY